MKCISSLFQCNYSQKLGALNNSYSFYAQICNLGKAWQGSLSLLPVASATESQLEAEGLIFQVAHSVAANLMPTVVRGHSRGI